LNVIIEGFLIEVREEIKLTSGLKEGSSQLQEAQNNICDTWKEVFNLLDDIDKDIPFDKDAPLTVAILRNPLHPVTQLMQTIYTMESFVYGALNKASYLGDATKAQSMGPYA
jgi:hypothetical protein